MGKSSGKAKQRVVDYFISAHYGVCAEADELIELHYGEKRLWSGSVTGNTTLAISKPSLFGGNKVEGGFRGYVDIMLGGDAQLAPPLLAQSLYRNGAAVTADPAQLPGFRGLCSFFVSGDGSFTEEGLTIPEILGGRQAGRDGANIGSNTAVVKQWWTRLRRAPKGAPFDTVIDVNGMKLANPAGIIWECLTDSQWGMSSPSSLLNSDSFSAAASTLAAEGFGLALLWHQQQTIEEFVGSILDHIEATLAFDPFTGQFKLTLIRGDYDIDDVPVFGPHNAVLEGFERRAWGETINEINVVWTNPATEQTETVTVHDTANVSLQGGYLISETREYPGIRTSALALRVATRDLQAASSALATANLRVNRSAWRVLPGEVIALEWPVYGFERLAMRVTNVDYGKPGDSHIQLTLVEDVFTLPEQSYVTSEGSAWINPAIAPVPLSHEHVTSMPYYLLAQAVGDSEAETTSDTTDIDLAFGTHPASGIRGFEMAEQIADAMGTPQWTPRGSVQLAGRGALAAPLVRETSSLLETLDDLVQGYTAAQGALVWIGPIDNTGELAQITQVTASGYTLRRGILDTVPTVWPAGTQVGLLPTNSLGTTGDERSLSETVTLRYLTDTSLGQLDIDDAANVSTTMTGRLHLPYRPANVRAGGFLWPDPDWYSEYPLTISWSGRNRLEETTLTMAWDEGSITPEPGTDYRVIVRAVEEDGTVNGTVSDTYVSAEEFSLAAGDIPAGLAGSPYMEVSITSRRDDLESWQPATIRFRGPFRAPTGLFASYKAPTAPADFNVTILPSE